MASFAEIAASVLVPEKKMTLESEIAALEEEKQAQTDEYYSRENIIETLSDILQKQDTSAPVYVAPQLQTKAPNYLLYIGAAIAAFLLLKK